MMFVYLQVIVLLRQPVACAHPCVGVGVSALLTLILVVAAAPRVALQKSSRAMVACGKALDALTHLKTMRLSEQKANFQPYQTSKCGKRPCTSGSSVETPTKSSKVSKSITWSHKFVCLAMTTATKVPTSKEKSFLSSVGLGEKVIMFPSMQVMLDEFQDILKRHYPQLEESGGFDLLKCKPNTQESLYGCLSYSLDTTTSFEWMCIHSSIAKVMMTMK